MIPEESDLEQYFLIDEEGNPVAKFIGKDDSSNEFFCFLFEFVKPYPKEHGDRDGRGFGSTLLFGRYGRYGYCKYKCETAIIRKLSEKEALARLI